MKEPEGGSMISNAPPHSSPYGGGSPNGEGSRPTLRAQLTAAYDAQDEKAKALDALDLIAQQTGNQQIAALVAILRKS